MQGKVIFITGGAKRVGAAICRRLHARGARLVVHYRSSLNEAKILYNELNQKRSDSVALVQADLLDTELLPDLIEKAAQRFGQMDVLINNASSFFPTLLQQCTLEDWRDLVGSNLQAPLFLAQAAAPYLKRRHGCVVNIVDIHTERPLKNYVIYNAAKGGLLSLTKSLAVEMAPEVRVNGVSPGPIYGRKMANGPMKQRARKLLTVPYLNVAANRMILLKPFSFSSPMHRISPDKLLR